MKNIWKGLLLMLMTIFLSMSMNGQSLKFTAATSKNKLAEGDRFRVEFRLNSGGDRFTPPSFEGFRVLSGPQRSQSTQIINGNVSQSIGFSYVLMALKEGEYTIGPASIENNGNRIESNELAITVTKGNPPSSSGQAQAGASSDLSDNVFIRATVSKTDPYVGEPIVATYKLYYNMGILGSEVGTIPSLNGFWTEDIDFEFDGRETELVNGVRYNVAVLKKTVLIPQRSGELTVDEFGLDLTLRQVVQSRSRNIFDQIMGSYKQVPLSVESRPLNIKVKALPPGKPAGFAGAVGEYKVDFKSDKENVKSNEAINFTYTIEGKGNIKLLNEPKVEFPSDFETYDAKLTEKIKVHASGMSGSRSYTYLAIPRHKGDFTVTPEAFSYFDPKKEKYFTLRPSPKEFHIEKGEEGGESAISFSGSNKEDIKLLGSDIRYISTDTEFRPMGHTFFGSFWHLLFWLLPLPLFFLIRFLKIRYEAKMSDAVSVKRSKANKMAVKRLSEAKKHISDGDDKKFYEEIFKALYGFFGDKFNIAMGELNKEKIRDTLISNEVDSSLVDRTEEIIDACEMARFAPVKNVGHEEMYRESVQVLSELQKHLK